MKRSSLIALLLFVCTLGVCAKGKQPIAFKDLPEPVKNAVLANYTPTDVQFITSEKVFRNYEYEFTMKDGTQLEYDAKAKLHKVENKKGVAPAYIPQNIQKYVAHMFPNTVITEYKRTSFRQEVELNNQMELIFNKRGKFLRIDD